MSHFDLHMVLTIGQGGRVHGIKGNWYQSYNGSWYYAIVPSKTDHRINEIYNTKNEDDFNFFHKDKKQIIRTVF